MYNFIYKTDNFGYWIDFNHVKEYFMYPNMIPPLIIWADPSCRSKVNDPQFDWFIFENTGIANTYVADHLVRILQ